MSDAKSEKRIQDASGVRMLPTREGYDAWAPIYDGESNPLVTLEEREIGALLGPVAGLSVLDVGCGTGRHAFRLVREKAREVMAIDFSEGMLAQARHKPGAEKVTFLQHDLAKPLPFVEGRFDRVLCGLVVDHIANLELLFREMARVCKPEGFTLVTTMHPALLIKGVEARFTDPATGRETRPASVSNTISNYVMAASRAGVRIDHMSEHPADEALAKAAPRAEKYLGWPLMLAMRLRK
jgi:malonyl-CoA O-methyltransferase